MMSDVPKQGAAVMTAETTVAHVDTFISRMGKVRLAEDRLTSALEGMAIEGGSLTPTNGDGTGPSRVATDRSKKRRCPNSSGRRFSQAAREAAVAARKAKALLQMDPAAPRVFIVRYGAPTTPFTWEIRRFGGVVLVKGDSGYTSLEMAWAAGEAMLAEASPA